MGSDRDDFLAQLKRLKKTSEPPSPTEEAKEATSSEVTLSSDPEIEAMKKKIAADPKLQERLAALERMITKKLGE